MEEREVLKKIGFTDNEADAYLALVDLEQAGAGEVARRTGFHRSDTYDVLERLVKKGFVSAITVGDKKIFKPNDPHQLLQHLEDRRKELEQYEGAVKGILPNLLKAYSVPREADVSILRGPKGLKLFFQELLRDGHDIREITHARGSEFLPGFFRSFYRDRCDKGLRIFSIYPEERKGNYAAKLKLKEVRCLPSGQYTSPIELQILPKKVALLLWSTRDPPTIIYIRDENAAKGFREYWDMLWKISKK